MKEKSEVVFLKSLFERLIISNQVKGVQIHDFFFFLMKNVKVSWATLFKILPDCLAILELVTLVWEWSMSTESGDLKNWVMFHLVKEWGTLDITYLKMRKKRGARIFTQTNFCLVKNYQIMRKTFFMKKSYQTVLTSF